MKIEGCGSVESLEKGKPNGRCRKWRLWVRADGKNRSRRFNGTYREAQSALDDFKDEIASRIIDDETFGSYAAMWCRLRRDSLSYSPNTIAKDEREIRAISRVLGDKKMDSITPDICRDALNRMKNGDNASGKTLTNTTMCSMYVRLKQVFRQAVDDGRIASNPMDRIRPPKKDTEERSALKPSEIGELLDRLDELPCDGRVMAVYLIACLGLRRAEACGLLDENVSEGIAYVTCAVKDRDGSLSKPKSKAGMRKIPMSSRLMRKVDEWRGIRAEMGFGDAKTLACDTRGGVLLPQNLWRWWHGDKEHIGKREELGFDGIVLHQLRHSNLTMMARHLSPFDLQRYAGWSSLEPAKIYIHDDLESVKKGVNEAWEE